MRELAWNNCYNVSLELGRSKFKSLFSYETHLLILEQSFSAQPTSQDCCNRKNKLGKISEEGEDIDGKIHTLVGDRFACDLASDTKCLGKDTFYQSANTALEYLRHEITKLV